MSKELQKAIEAKSSQLNADDLMGGGKEIAITSVKVTPGEQPVTISYHGDEGKPYKPSKGMTRALVLIWGDDETQWAGRSLTLYRNPEVKWAGLKVGGIQISHASHIKGDVTFALTLSKGNKSSMLIKKMATAAPVVAQQAPPETDHQASLDAAALLGTEALKEAWGRTPNAVRKGIDLKVLKAIAAKADEHGAPPF